MNSRTKIVALIYKSHTIFLLGLCFVLLPFQGMTQNATYRKSLVEFRVGGGGSIFLGDLGGNFQKRKDAFFDFDPSTARYVVNLGAKYNFTKWLALRSDYNIAKVAADDALAAEGFRKDRNLSFQSSINEVTLMGELVLLNLLKLKALQKLHTELYVFGGVGFFRFKPKAELNGIWYSLRELSTEGQGIIPGTKPYSTVSGVIPLGFGIRKLVGSSSTVGIELSLRKSFTDYIDDVSGRYYNKEVIREHKGHVAAELSDRSIGGNQSASSFRGNPKQNDNYAFLQVFLNKGISNQLVLNERQAFRKISNKMYKCPRFK